MEKSTATLIIERYKGSGAPPTRQQYRSAVEKILNNYLDVDYRVKLSFDSYGEPLIRQNANFAFSYSHSNQILALAIHPGAESIGVDIEPLARFDEIYIVKDLAFSKKELSTMTAQDYVSNWCLKEAAVKRLGKGFRDFNPAEVNIRVNQNQYNLEVNDKVIQQGYFKKIMNGSDCLVICSDLPVEEVSMREYWKKI